MRNCQWIFVRGDHVLLSGVPSGGTCPRDNGQLPRCDKDSDLPFAEPRRLSEVRLALHCPCPLLRYVTSKLKVKLKSVYYLRWVV